MNIIADTCFWISLCDDSQSDHDDCILIFDKIIKDQEHKILVPNPVLYESLCTRMIKKPKEVLRLTYDFFPFAVKVSDTMYLEDAYRLIQEQAKYKSGTASLVDTVIRLMIDNPDNRIRAVLTKNGRDFGDLWGRRGVPMIDSFEKLCSI